MPDGQLVTVAVPDRDVGPPDLMVGRGEHAAKLRPGDSSAQGDVDMGSQPPLGFDRGEVLHVGAEVAAQVLDEPVEQRREGQRVPGRLTGTLKLQLYPSSARQARGECDTQPGQPLACTAREATEAATRPLSNPSTDDLRSPGR